MKKIIRRIYSSDFAESSTEQTQRPRNKRRLLKIAGSAAAIGAGGYLFRNTDTGLKIRNAASNAASNAANKAKNSAKRKIFNSITNSVVKGVNSQIDNTRSASMRKIYSGVDKVKDGANRVIKKFRKN